MGAHPYWYVVPFEDPQAALEKLRAREFKAGRYNPVIRYLRFPITEESPAPGAKHASIADALADSAEAAEGTRSILDISRISDVPEDFCAAPLDENLLKELYGSAKPARAQVEANMDFLGGVERGQAVYIILYQDDRASEIMFAGYSFD